MVLSISSRSFLFLIWASYFSCLFSVWRWILLLVWWVCYCSVFGFGFLVVRFLSALFLLVLFLVVCSMFQYGFFLLIFWTSIHHHLLVLVFGVVGDFSFVTDIVCEGDGHSFPSALFGFVYPGHVAFLLRLFYLWFLLWLLYVSRVFQPLLEGMWFYLVGRWHLHRWFLGFLFCVLSGRVFYFWTFSPSWVFLWCGWVFLLICLGIYFPLALFVWGFGLPWVFSWPFSQFCCPVRHPLGMFVCGCSLLGIGLPAEHPLYIPVIWCSLSG